MIEGIHILNKTVIMENQPWVFWALCVLLVSFAVCFSLMFIFADKCLYGLSVSMGVFAGIFGFSFILLCGLDPEQPTGRYEYEVTIDDSVSMNEFYDTYDIVEQRGDIWVIEDKEKYDE